jgi:hypothetical protein
MRTTHTTKVLTLCLAICCSLIAPFGGSARAEKAKKGKKASKAPSAPSSAPSNAVLTPTAFEATPDGGLYNASGIVEIAEGRFLLCDNKTPDALFELHLDAQGNKVGPLVRRALRGIDIQDAEGMATVETGGKRFIAVTSSFNRLHGYQGKQMVPLDGFADGLLRIEAGPDGELSARTMPGIRAWLLSKYATVLVGADRVPDQGGLNIEGFGWDPVRGALLFGLRTPLVGGRPVVLPVRVLNGGDPWTTASLEALPPIVLDTGAPPGGHGIRGLCYDPVREVFVVSLGKAISGTQVDFAQFQWDGGSFGTLRPLPGLTFARTMKAEGVTRAHLGAKEPLVYVDDAGGFLVVWDAAARLP